MAAVCTGVMALYILSLANWDASCPGSVTGMHPHTCGHRITSQLFTILLLQVTVAVAPELMIQLQ